MHVLFVTDFSPIVTDANASKQFYIDTLGLPLSGEPPASEKLEGVKHFGLWPLQHAAQACFGVDEWPSHIPIPQANLEFEVLDVAAAAAELDARLHRLASGTDRAVGANHRAPHESGRPDYRHLLHAVVPLIHAE
jgi:catechol 2,3-dioxygenase-like lactoylglutathione lyase family enzyme